MPRQARIDSPGLLQHVIARGVNRADIFLDDFDREKFVERLETLLEETGTKCYAWALLDNHFHLLIIPVEVTLATFMRRLLTGYAVAFNLRYRRTGHLFQNRYKSIVCDGDSYLLELIRYIHLNPVRAGICKDLIQLESYPWSGHRQLLGTVKEELICAEEVLPFFSRRKKSAKKLYLKFLADGLQQGEPPRLSQGGRRTSQHLDKSLDDDYVFDDRILGGGDFARQVLDDTVDERTQPTLEQIVETIAEYYNLNHLELVFPSKEKKIVQAKSVICFFAMRHYRKTGVEVAKRLGYSTSAASHAAIRGRRVLGEDAVLQRFLAKMWK